MYSAFTLKFALTSVRGFNPRTTEMDDLSDLLQTNIEETRIKVKCSSASTTENVEKCLEMNRVPELCPFSWLCGKECRLACLEEEPKHILIQDIEQLSCSVSWFLEDSSYSSQFIVVAGAGMWRVLEDGYTQVELELTAPDSLKYRKISVLAISDFGVEDVHSIQVQPSNCEIVQVYKQSSPTSDNTNIPNLQIILLVSAILTLCFSCFSVLLYSKRKPTQEHTEKLNPIIKDESKCMFLIHHPEF